MKILITGGSGFVAKNLFEQLQDKYEIVSLNSKDLNLLNSLSVLNYLKRNKFDVIIHTATYDAVRVNSGKDPVKVLEYNLKMFFNIVRCSDYFGKLIYFGSGAEFGREFWKPRMDENYFDQNVPTDQYGFSKYVMTKYAQSHQNIYNLRLFGVFGKYDDWKTRVIPNVCYQAAMNVPIKIEQNKYYDFLYADDLVRIVKWFMDNKPKKNIYNICTGKVFDFQTIAKKIVELSGKNLKIKIEQTDLGKEYSGDNALLLKELKEFKFTSIDNSLKNLYGWYDKNKEEIFKNK
jgi:GDP-L-fucose synthase